MRLIATDVVCSVVCLSVCVLVTLARCTKTAESIEMPFGKLTHVAPGNHVLYGGWDPAREGATLGMPAHWKELGVSAAVCTAKGIIPSFITSAAAVCNALDWLVSHYSVPRKNSAPVRCGLSSTLVECFTIGFHLTRKRWHRGPLSVAGVWRPVYTY